MKQEWALKLFEKSVLKQRKYREIVRLLGPTAGLRCLDIGADNGVISLLLRNRGGNWASADLDERSVASIRELVGTDVHRIDGGRTPFADEEFDRVVVVDFLEHIADDEAFMREMARILKPDGEIILNVPHKKDSLLRRFRQAIGQTDVKHGHLRPGYTAAELRRVAGPNFVLRDPHTYSRFFSEFIDTLITFWVSMLKRGGKEESAKGTFVTGRDLNQYRSMFRAYSIVYPIVWFFAKLDNLLFFRDGYMLIAKGHVVKQPAVASQWSDRQMRRSTLLESEGWTDGFRR